MQLHCAQAHAALQGLQISHIHLQRIPGQQRALRGVQHFDLLGLYAALQLERRHRRLHKRHLHIGVQHRRLQPHRQTLGQIAQVGRKIKVGQVDAGVGLRCGGKRRGLGLRLEHIAIELERQVRQHLDVALRWQAADKRQLQRQRAQRVAAAHGIVLKVHRTALHRDVVQGKTGGPALWRRFGGGQPGQHIVNVITARGQALQPHHGRIDLQRIHHRGQAP